MSATGHKITKIKLDGVIHDIDLPHDATPDIATLDVSQDVAIDGILKVLSNNGTSEITNDLTVGHDLTVNNGTSVGGNLAVTGNTTVSGTASITGNTTISGNTSMGGTANITGKTTITNSTDATASDGALKVSGGIRVNKKLNVGSTADIAGVTTITDTTEASTSAGALKVSGGARIDKKLNVGSDTQIAGNTNIDGTLNINGKVSITNTTAATSTNNGDGALHIKGGVKIAKNLIVDTTASIAGKTSITNTTDASASDGAIKVSGGARIDKKLNVGTDAAIGGAASIGGNLGVSGTAAVAGNTTLSGTLTTVENAQFNANVDVDGTLNADGDTTLGGTLTVNNATTLKGATAINNTLTVGTTSAKKATTLNGTATITGITSITDTTDAGGGTAALQVSGGARIEKKLSVGTNAAIEGNLTVTGTTTTADPTADSHATTKSWVENAITTAINNLPEAMVFKGTVGSGGTVTWTNLPQPAAANVQGGGTDGHTYKVITAYTNTGSSDYRPTCKVGDTIVSTASTWVVIPSGDDIEDTWRQIKVNGNDFKGTGISTGLVNFVEGGHITLTSSGNNITLGVESGYGIGAEQTAYTTAQGSTYAIPKIKTNALGQVTEITTDSTTKATISDTSGEETVTVNTSASASKTLNVVTRDTAQEITVAKTFKNGNSNNKTVLYGNNIALSGANSQISLANGSYEHFSIYNGEGNFDLRHGYNDTTYILSLPNKTSTLATIADIGDYIAPAYNSSTTYSTGSKVTYNGKFYRYKYTSSASNKVPTNTIYWEQIKVSTQYVDTDTSQDISGIKTFRGDDLVVISDTNLTKFAKFRNRSIVLTTSAAGIVGTLTLPEKTDTLTTNDQLPKVHRYI